MVNYIYRKAQVENMSEIGRNQDFEKLLQTESVPQKLVKLVQLKIHSERTTHQKTLRLVLRGRYEDGLMFLKS